MSASSWSTSAILRVVDVTRDLLDRDPAAEDAGSLRRALRAYGAELDRRGIHLRPLVGEKASGAS